MNMRGIDISKHNGAVNWAQVKADGVQFAILRAGYGKEASQKDTQFEANYIGCKAQGIPCGAYWYSYAATPAEARQEAAVCLSFLKAKPLRSRSTSTLRNKRCLPRERPPAPPLQRHSWRR